MIGAALVIMSSGITAFSTSGTIDLYDDVPMSLNYNIADVKEPQKRNADYSKTLTVPGTNNNNKLLGHIYEIGVDRLYNVNHKVEARVMYGGTVFKGYMRLAKIRVLKGQKVEYDLELRGRLDDLFTNLTDKKLTDLTWTDLNHTYNRTNIVNSWSGTAGSNYVYPFIDYGFTGSPSNYDVNNFYPAVYVKEAWDRIFRYAGFQYSSTFLTSSFFKSLILPFTSEAMRLTTAQLQARNFQAERVTSSQLHTAFQSSGTATSFGNYEYFNNVFNDDNGSGNTDGGNNYNTATGVYTVPANGYYYFTANLTFDAIATPNTANQYINQLIRAYPRLIKNGVAVSYGAGYVINFGVNSGSTYSTVQTGTPYGPNIYVTYAGFFNAGDTFYIDFQARLESWFTAPGGNNVTYQLRLNTGSYFYAKAEPIIKNGDTITFANTLPQDMKIVDFVVSIIKMFNLYIEYDKDVPNKMYIETRNDYYNSTIQDWSAKLDVSKEPEIIPMGALNAKRYRFTYKKDEDVLNKDYQTTYGEVYAEKYRDIDNDFLKNTDTMEVIFSPTPQYGVPGTGRFYPALFNVDANQKIVHNKSMNPRILIYGGLKSCTKWYLYSNGLPGTQLSSYPYCGMMDDPEDPTVSLDFGVPKKVMYTPAFNGGYTNNNLYNKYWKQFIEEITDYNSSIVTAWFWLSPADIMQVDFRHVYRFLNQNFRLNKICDYNPDAQSLTKCEFIKLKQGIPFVPQKKKLTGGADEVYDGVADRVPAPPDGNTTGNNSVPTLGIPNIIQGQLNYVSPTATNILINGNSNSVGTDADNVTIQQSSGITVAGGVVNVQVFNSSGITVTESNVVYQNNVKTLGPNYAKTGEYTPQFDYISNSSASVAPTGADTWIWSRNDTMVTVSGFFRVAITAGSTMTEVGITLPIASNITGNGDLNGAAVAQVGTVNVAGRILPAGGSEPYSARFEFISSGTSDHIFSMFFQYKII